MKTLTLNFLCLELMELEKFKPNALALYWNIKELKE